MLCPVEKAKVARCTYTLGTQASRQLLARVMPVRTEQLFSRLACEPFLRERRTRTRLAGEPAKRRVPYAAEPDRAPSARRGICNLAVRTGVVRAMWSIAPKCLKPGRLPEAKR